VLFKYSAHVKLEKCTWYYYPFSDSKGIRVSMSLFKLSAHVEEDASALIIPSNIRQEENVTKYGCIQILVSLRRKSVHLVISCNIREQWNQANQGFTQIFCSLHSKRFPFVISSNMRVEKYYTNKRFV
jgi:hypothetical protein